MSCRTVIAAVAVVAVLAAGCGDDSNASRDTFRELAVYDLDGEPTVLPHEGRPIVINFFAESCAPCIDEMPAFDAVYRSVAGDVDFLGVAEDPTASAATRIIEATGITYPTVWDADGTAIVDFEGFALPTTVFIDADGEVVDVHTGALSEDALRERVAELVPSPNLP